MRSILAPDAVILENHPVRRIADAAVLDPAAFAAGVGAPVPAPVVRAWAGVRASYI